MAALEEVADGAGRRGAVVAVEVQRDDVVGGRRLGGVGAHVERHGLVGLAGHDHPAALGPQHLGQTQAGGEGQVLLFASRGRDHPDVLAAVAGVDDHDRAGEARLVGEAFVAVGDLLALAARFGLAQGVELAQRVVADHAVGRQTGVALKVDQRALDRGVEDAALGSGVEAEEVELDLQRQYVVAAKGGDAQVQQAVAERVAGLDQLVPGVGPEDAVDEQPALLLEGPEGELAGRPEKAVEAFVAELVPEPVQPLLHVGDFFAAIAESQCAHEGRRFRPRRGCARRAAKV